jgi:aryl-alcohol dehydrogenase-like predicted oxidoreductase
MQASDFLSRCVLGTTGLGGVWGKIDPTESIKAILMALANGITCIDTAPAYGDAESFVGIALNEWEGQKPLISTKIGRLKSYSATEGVYDYSNDGMEKSVENSLKALGTSDIDILFLHEPDAIPEKSAERVLEKLVQFKERGYTTKIGLGGNSPAWFKKYITSDVFDVVMEYNRLNVCCTDALYSSLPDYNFKGINFYVASPLYMGLLGNRFEEYTASPPGWLKKNSIERAKQVKLIADKYQMPLSSLAHRFLLSLPENFKIVIGPKNSHQLQQTVIDFRKGPLPENIIEEIKDLKNYVD